jgi:hypothetical protein
MTSHDRESLDRLERLWPSLPARARRAIVELAESFAEPVRWLTVGGAAAKLQQDLPWLSESAAKVRVSRACSAGKLTCEGVGAARRIDPESLDAWRLRVRDTENIRDERRTA